ncbi:MAG TPA: hypothetical protein VEK39_01495 [Solirubrobacterales bacterium]|nr:hypothetical protein [Solirubrobacterales bacterium]
MTGDVIRSRALAFVGLFAATLVLGIVLLIAFEPDIQDIDADELVARSDDARAFLAADYLFIVLYAILSPIAIWRFGTTLGDGSPPLWIRLAPLCLAAAGVFDAIENTLLLSATDSASSGAVDAAHAVAIPKVALFVAGAALAIAALVRAIQVLRAT